MAVHDLMKMIENLELFAGQTMETFHRERHDIIEQQVKLFANMSHFG